MNILRPILLVLQHYRARHTNLEGKTIQNLVGVHLARMLSHIVSTPASPGACGRATFRGICAVDHSIFIELPELDELCLFVGLVVAVLTHRRMRREAISEYPDTVLEQYRNPRFPRLNSVFSGTSFVFAEAEEVLCAITSNPLHTLFRRCRRCKEGVLQEESPSAPGFEEYGRFALMKTVV